MGYTPNLFELCGIKENMTSIIGDIRDLNSLNDYFSVEKTAIYFSYILFISRIFRVSSNLLFNKFYSNLKDKLSSANSLFTPFHLWSNYKILDDDGVVEEIDKKQNVNALTNLIQLVRFAYGRTAELSSLFTGYLQRFK